MAAIDLDAIGKLGFGLMRLPKRAGRIDIDETSRMVDAFLEAGGTYFDTAFVYPGSEKAMRKALVERHPRESYTIATKLFATAVPTAGLAKKELATSLSRAGTGYVDFYLLHSLMDANWKKYERFGLWDFVAEERDKGTIRHYGFSFHGGPELLDRLLTAHPDAEFVQLQVNYADWENPSVQARANWEVARAHGKPIVIMEPVKGGRLANPPMEARALLDEANARLGLDWSHASWALRFAASLDGVMCVLSGMSDSAQMADNLATFRDFEPLDADGRAVVRRCMEAMGHVSTIACTACGYCREGCPQKIPIPDIFSAMNDLTSTGQAKATKEAYALATAEGGRASDCVACGQCEGVCPQHLPIIEDLAACAEALE